MKKIKKKETPTIECAERDRLWTAFLKVGKDWHSLQDAMRKELERKGTVAPDVAKLEEIIDRIDRTHRLFSEHIDKHGCWQPKTIPSGRPRAKENKK